MLNILTKMVLVSTPMVLLFLINLNTTLIYASPLLDSNDTVKCHLNNLVTLTVF